MKKETKDDIQVLAAVGMLFSGTAMSFFGFFCEPVGLIHDSVLWFFAQCLVWAGSIFGIKTYVAGQIDKVLNSKNKENDK